MRPAREYAATRIGGSCLIRAKPAFYAGLRRIFAGNIVRTHHPNRRPYNWLVYRAFDQWLAARANTIRGDVVELGAGEAPYRTFFTERSRSYLTVDWSNSQHKIDVDVIADLNREIPLPDASADIAVSISVMEHLLRPDVFLAEVARILRPQGQFLLQVPWQWMVHEAPHDYFRYSPFALRRMLEANGFEVVSLDPSAGAFSTLCLKVNYLSCRLIRGPLPVQSMIRSVLTPVWWLGQHAALQLDRFDRDKLAEAPGYCVLARLRSGSLP